MATLGRGFESPLSGIWRNAEHCHRGDRLPSTAAVRQQPRGQAGGPTGGENLPLTPQTAAATRATVACDACPDVSCPSFPGMLGAFAPPEVFQLFARCTWSPDGREAPEGFAEIKDDRIWLGDLGQTGRGCLPAFTAPHRTLRTKGRRGISR